MDSSTVIAEHRDRLQTTGRGKWYKSRRDTLRPVSRLYCYEAGSSGCGHDSSRLCVRSGSIAMRQRECRTSQTRLEALSPKGRIRESGEATFALRRRQQQPIRIATQPNRRRNRRGLLGLLNVTNRILCFLYRWHGLLCRNLRVGAASSDAKARIVPTNPISAIARLGNACSPSLLAITRRYGKQSLRAAAAVKHQSTAIRSSLPEIPGPLPGDR
jgi:hypothetical protein